MQTDTVRGTLILSYPQLDDLECLLMQVDENGCCGRISFQRIPAEHAVAWKRLLLPNLQLNMTVDVPEKIRFESHGMVERAKEFYIYCDYYFHFSLEPKQRSAIQQALGHSAKKSSINLPVVPSAKPVAKPPATKTIPAKPKTAVVRRQDTATLAAKPAQVPRAAGKGDKLGEILVHMGHLNTQQVEKAILDAKAEDLRLGRFLIKSGLVTPKIVSQALGMQSGLPTVDLGIAEIQSSHSTIFPYSVLKENLCVPFDAGKKTVSLAVALPLSSKAARELQHACGREIEMFVAEEDLIAKRLDHIFRGRKPRKFTRYACSIPAQYQFCGRLGTPIEETVHSDSVVNISQGGMAFLCAPSIPESVSDMRRTDVYANVLLDSEIHAICQLRWVRRSGAQDGGAPWLIGVEIVEISGNDQEKLKNLCMQAAKAKP
jgi:hypothetical protein